jgi:hypothetical protein
MALKELGMGGAVIGLIALTGISWVLFGILWRRSVVIQRTLSEPGLVQSELLRRLADSYAAAKLLLDACPESDLPGACAQRRGYLSVAVAAVEELASESDLPPQSD